MVVPLGLAMGLLVAMTTKHFLADFLLQTAALARGKAADAGWMRPLTIHAGTHAIITLAVALAVVPAAWWVAPLEMALHAGIDRAKVIVSRSAHLDPSTNGFWWLLGLDQYLHQMTNVAIVLAFLFVAT